jgi:hypothetical protein
VEGGSAVAGQDGEDWISPLREALAGVAPGGREAIGQLIVLYREFPAWAGWLPDRGRPRVTQPARHPRGPRVLVPMRW